MAGVPFRFLDTGRRPENGLARSLLQAHSADENQYRVRTTGDQSRTALFFCVLECLVLYIEYMSVSIFISGIAHSGGTECEDPVDCVQSIGMGLAVYSAGVGYFAFYILSACVDFAAICSLNCNRSRYASFFGEATYSVVLDGVGLSWDKFRIQMAPCGHDCARSSTVILVVHVFGNMMAASYLLPSEVDSTPSWTRFTAEPTRAARAVLMSPVLEELIFRGLMSCVIYNRCRDPKPGIANAMFAAIHLNNMLGTDTPREEIYLQCAMAFVLGWYYALRLQRGGSLWETIFMHAVNNSLAMLYDAALVEDRVSLLLGVAATIGLYTVGIVYEVWRLRGTASDETVVAAKRE